MRRLYWLLLVLVMLVFVAPVTADERVRVGDFINGDLSGWEEKSFKGNTRYDFVLAKTVGGLIDRTTTDQSSADTGKVLRAKTKGQASGLFKEMPIDLNKTPILNWSWRVKNLFKDNDERSKEGDDYPARIYVVVSGGIFFWKTKAINYVWSSNQAMGSEWPNAYTDHARMIAVQAGSNHVGEWVMQRRNVREDLKRLFGEDLSKIDAIAVMVDGDNTGQSATAYFGDIVFSED